MKARRTPRAVLRALLAAAALLGAGSGSGAAAEPPLQLVALVPPPSLRDGFVNEPHLALDPVEPSVLVAVAQSAPPPPPAPSRSAFVVWRSEDGGRSWTSSRPLAGRSGAGYVAADPVVALGPGGAAVLAAITFDPAGRCTIVNRVGSYRSANGGRSFGPLVAAGPTLRLPRVAIDEAAAARCGVPKSLVGLAFTDKPWIAV